MSLFDNLFGGKHQLDSPELAAAVDWAVNRVEPLLKRVGGYPERYLEPVANALRYVDELAAQVPGPVKITPDAYAADPVVHALFPLQDDIHEAMAVSRAMQDFQLSHPDLKEVYALVCMRRKVKEMFGMEMQGEVLRRDVHQEAIYFTDYTLAEPGLTEAESRRAIAHGFFESLVAHVANRIEARKQERDRLEHQRDECLAGLRESGAERRDQLQAELDGVLGRLTDLVRSLEMDRYSQDFSDVMLEPQRYLYLERAEMSLDSMGIVRRPDTDGSEELVFYDLIGRDRRRWTVTLMYCNQVKKAATITDRLEKAQRWLGL